LKPPPNSDPPSKLVKIKFRISFNVNGLIVLILILGAALLSMITAALVAYGSVPVRPP